MKLKHCKWCDNSFNTNIAYQIYCSAECREFATREKIAERYISNKIKKRVEKNRTCKSCGIQLSIYNDNVLCENCFVNPVDVKKMLNELKKMGKDGSE